MRLPQTKIVTEWLRSRARLNKKSQKISLWVEEYLDQCLLKGKAVNILTPWCLSKAIVVRYKASGCMFQPRKKEEKLFVKEVPAVLKAFEDNGFILDWFFTFHRSYHDDRLLPESIELDYKTMICDLVKVSGLDNKIILLDWEDDMIGKRVEPNQTVLANINQHVNQQQFTRELERWKCWHQDQLGITANNTVIKDEVKYQVACEAEEGRILLGGNSPFGTDFLLIPLEYPERFDNFTILTPDFKKRIVTVFPYYPWRI